MASIGNNPLIAQKQLNYNHASSPSNVKRESSLRIPLCLEIPDKK